MAAVLGGASSGDGGRLTHDSPAFRLLAEHVTKGECILFLGAGVHHPPPDESRFRYPEKERPPLGKALAQQLAGGCDFARICAGDDPTNLQRVALCYEKELGRPALEEKIRRAVEDNTEPSAAVRALAELPFPLVVTTNYDTIFERALHGCGKRPHVAVYDPQRDMRTDDLPIGEKPSAKRPFVFKAHGDVTAPESIVVTDEDYITFVLRMNAPEGFHPFPPTFLFEFNRMSTLFVGYSLLDFNLRLLFRTLRWRLDVARSPESYSVDVRPDPLVSDTWTRQHRLRFLVEDVWEFVPRLCRQVLNREMPA